VNKGTASNMPRHRVKDDRFFGGYPSRHSELHHSEKGDPHSSRHGQMEALS
ncbi:unnamed protein product, partial [Gulo gulo]